MDYIDKHTIFFLSGNQLFDESLLGKAINNKNVTVSADKTKFIGEKSLYFDGLSSRMEVSIPIELLYNKKFEFTIDGWFYLLPKTVNYPTPFSYRGQTNDGIYVHFQSDATIMRDRNGSNAQQQTNAVPINQWFHFAVIKQETVDEFYLNGKLVAKLDFVTKNSYKKLILGQLGNDPNTWFKGYMQHFRISDIARWNSNFTPPSDPYVAKPKIALKPQNPPSADNPVFVKVFTVNPKKRVNNRADLITRVFPEKYTVKKPTSYIKLEDRMGSGEFVAPTDGWYQLDAVSASGRGADGGYNSLPDPVFNYSWSGAGGGSGAISRKTNIYLNAGEKISFTIADNEIRIEKFGIVVTPGKTEEVFDGKEYPHTQRSTRSVSGTAVGGDENYSGIKGGDGIKNPIGGIVRDHLNGGSGGVLEILGYTLKGGKGGDLNSTFESPSEQPQLGEPATNPNSFIRFYHGNTNIVSN